MRSRASAAGTSCCATPGTRWASRRPPTGAIEGPDGIGPVEHVDVQMATIVRDLLSIGTTYLGDADVPLPRGETWSEPAISGGGYGQAQLTHAIGLVLRLVPSLRASAVAAFTASPGTAVELHDAIAVRFDSGAIGAIGGASMPLGAFGDQHQLSIRITGQRGQVLLDMAAPRVARSTADTHLEVELSEEDVRWSFDRVTDRMVDLAIGATTENPSPGRPRRPGRRDPRRDVPQRGVGPDRDDQPGLIPTGGVVTSGRTGTDPPARTVATGTSRCRASRPVPAESTSSNRPSSSARTVTSAAAPTARLPRPAPAGPSAAAGAVVAMATTSSIDSPRSRNLDSVVARSWTGRRDVEPVEVGADRVRPEAVGQRGLRGPPGEAPGAVADVEADAAGACLAGGGHDPPAVGEDPARIPAGVGMGDDVVRAQAVERLLDVERRAADVDHDRQARRPAGLERPVQARQPVRAGEHLRHAHLEPHDDVGVGPRHGRGPLRIGEAQVVQLAEERVDLAGRADVEVGEDPAPTGSTTWRRKPGNVLAPDEPASTTVVTPRPRQVGSASTDRSATPV